MRPLPELKNVNRERRMFQRRVTIAIGCMLLAIAVVLARLVYLQILHHDHYTTLSHDNRIKILPLPPPRGLIYSRDGVLLAENRPSFSLTVVPENARDVEGSLRELKTLLDLADDELDAISKRLRHARRFEHVTVKSDLTTEELATFAVNRFRFDGFDIEAGLARHYPLGEAFAHVVGYVGRISEADLDTIDQSNYAATTHIGKMGVERAREDLLHGKVGYQHVEVNALGHVLRVVERNPPLPGSDLYLTIDSGLQQEGLAALGGYRGAIVVVEPATGGILAFVSKPAYDPNEFVNGVSRKLYDSWNTSPDRPLFNRALQGQYPPGSTIKPMIALAGLEYGVRQPDSASWCPGWFSLPGDSHQYRDWLKTGHGHVTMKYSIAHSCDVYYYMLARDLGIVRLHAMLARFGLGVITGIDIPGEAQGLMPSPQWKKRARNLPWYPGETLIAGIGQGFMLATPLQLAYATAVIANRGQPTIPHFLAQIEDGQGTQTPSPDVYWRPQLELTRREHWDQIIDAMVEVVHGPTGTARRSGLGAPVRFAGKTGTAQVYGIAQGEKARTEGVPEHLQDHALFIAFAPVDTPQIALAVVVEHGGGGSKTAAPIARRLIDHYFARSAAATAGSGTPAQAPPDAAPLPGAPTSSASQLPVPPAVEVTHD